MIDLFRCFHSYPFAPAAIAIFAYPGRHRRRPPDAILPSYVLASHTLPLNLPHNLHLKGLAIPNPSVFSLLSAMSADHPFQDGTILRSFSFQYFSTSTFPVQSWMLSVGRSMFAFSSLPSPLSRLERR